MCSIQFTMEMSFMSYRKDQNFSQGINKSCSELERLVNNVQPIHDDCGEQIQLESPHDIIREQFWPGSATQKSTYVFDTDLFLFYDLLKKNNPGVSETGFLKTLEQISLAKGRVGSLNATTFSKAFNEWRYCQYSLRKLKHLPMFECPCCTPIQHSVHFDGNKKLYRYSKVPRGLNKQYYEEFIVPNEEVDRHLELTGYFGENTNEVGLCGTTRWKAAKAVSKSMTNLDETGLEVAGCRHALALKALNMFRGEIFGYPHYLHTKIFPRVKCVWADVICQYWPWALSKVNGYAELKSAMSAHPCLSVMHAKAHSWHCQILWGGRWQIGAANGAGEEMEQLFSYLSRFNLTTKYMSAAGREEQLIEAAMFWNIKKISNLPKYLQARLNKTRSDLEHLKKDLLLLQDKVGKDLTPEYCEECRREIQDIAKKESTACESAVESQKVEYFELKSTIDTATVLQPLLNGRSAAMSILTGNEQLYTEAEKFASILDSTKQNRLAELKTGLVTSSDISSSELDMACELAAAKVAVYKLQERIELVYLTAQRRHANIQQMSTTSKQRTKLRKAISVDHKKLQKLASQYNDLIDNYNLELAHTVVEEIACGHFPWSSLSSRHCISVQEKYKICTLYNQLQRLKEEENLLLQEMTQYLNYFKSTLPKKLQADIEDISKDLQQSANVTEISSSDTPTDIARESADVHAIERTESTPLTASKKYVLLNPKKTPVLEGLLAVKKSGLHEAVKLLKTAAQEFRSEYISNGEEEIDYSYLLNTCTELDFDEYESDDDV